MRFKRSAPDLPKTSVITAILSAAFGICWMACAILVNASSGPAAFSNAASTPKSVNALAAGPAPVAASERLRCILTSDFSSVSVEAPAKLAACRKPARLSCRSATTSRQ